MSKARTRLGTLLALVCVLALLFSATPALADEGDDDKRSTEASHDDKDDKNDKDDRDDDGDDRDDRDDADTESDERSKKSDKSDGRDDADAESDERSKKSDDRDGRDEDDDDARGGKTSSSSTSSSTSSDAGTSGGGSQGGNLRCPAGTVTFTINGNPGNGTFSDGTVIVTITNSDSDSFNWTSNRTLHSVMIKGGPVTNVNPGGTSGFAVSAFNPDSGKNYGISHVTICYSPDQVGGTPPPPPCDADLNKPGIQPCEQDDKDKVCPPNSDFPGSQMDDLEDCFKDEVEGRTDTNDPLKVCPSGPFKGMPFVVESDCDARGDDRVLPNVIRNTTDPAVDAAPEPVGGALPFTGAGGVALLGLVALVLGGLGLAALRVRKDTT